MQCLWTFCWFGGRETVNRSRQMPHTTKYLMRMDVRQERNQAQSSVVPPLGDRPSIHSRQLLSVCRPLGADPRSLNRMEFSANLNWHKQLMGREAFSICSPPSMWSSALGRWPKAKFHLVQFTFRPVQVGLLWTLLCLRLPQHHGSIRSNE